ncbi:MAG: hypothetical protein ABIJ57_02290 [Pseudomonadota bacterium]
MKKVKKTFIDSYTGEVIKANRSYSHRIMVGIPTTGLVRYEWVLARYGQVIPCNWSQVECVHFFQSWSPIGYQVADARNIIANAAINEGFEWLFFIDHDTIIPPITVLRWNEYMLKKEWPVFCGLYFTKSVPSEPLIYRGRGNSHFTNWKIGDKVWVDGIPMGCTVIHVSILKAMAEDSEVYDLGNGQKVRRIFRTPAQCFWDPEKTSWFTNTGTEDLDWCSRVIDGGYLKKAGWPKIQAKKYPFLMDTGLFCRHIDNSGIQFPSRGEEKQFIKGK